MNTHDSPEGRANVAAIEANLAMLDDVFLQFCSRHGYAFSSHVQLWPRRRVWRRQEIDRCMDLNMDVGVQDVLDRGFQPELPWSLYATGSLSQSKDPADRFLSRPVFEHLHFSQLASILASNLERGLEILNSMTESEILRDGQQCQQPAGPCSPAHDHSTAAGNSGKPKAPPPVN